MKLSLFLLPRAEADIDAHCSFFGNRSIEKALLFDQPFSIHSSDYAKCLPSEANANSSIQNFGESVCGRVKGFEKYVIYYRVFDNYIEIVRVLHSAQDVDSIIEDENIN